MVNTVNATIVKDTFNKEYNEDDLKYLFQNYCQMPT